MPPGNWNNETMLQTNSKKNEDNSFQFYFFKLYVFLLFELIIII